MRLNITKLDSHNRHTRYHLCQILKMFNMVLEMNKFHYVKKVFVSPSKFLPITGQNICQTAHMHNCELYAPLHFLGISHQIY